MKSLGLISNRLLIDCDDVIMDLITPWLSKANRFFDTDIKAEDITKWDIGTCSGLGHHIFSILEMGGFYASLEPIEGSVEALKELHNRGFDIILVTAMKNGLEDRRRWIQKYLPWLSLDNLVVTQRKELILGLLMVDDRVDNLLNASVSYKFLITKPWNAEVNAEDHNMIRLNSLSELPSLLIPENIN